MPPPHHDTTPTERTFALVWPEDNWQSPPMQEQTAREVFLAVNGAFRLELVVIEDGKRRVLLSWL